MTVKILNSANETQVILQNITNPIISEDLNREFTFSFLTVIDNDKSTYVNYQHKVEVEKNYFNIVYTEEHRTESGLFINAQCEHVSYDLLSANFTAGFTATGQFSAVATTLLSGTGFTVGTVQITASQTISVNESTNSRQVLMQLASLYGGELQFSKYQINLLTSRGANRGVQFRYRKNLVDVSRIVDNRKKIAGLPTISYKVNVAELEFEQGFIASGADANEHYELGDTIKVIDEDLNLSVSLRIVKESHDPEQRGKGTVEIGNFVDDLTDTLTTIQTTTVAKDNVYNGCSIGPENGFVAERSDQLVKTSTNATNGIEIDLRNTTTAAYTAVFYVQIDTATGTAKLYLAGNAEFTGIVRGSEIIGGSITIGSGSNTFNANGTDGIWLGSSAFSTAPFSCSLSGALTANSATIRGDIIAGSTFTVATGSNTIRADSNGLYVGSSAFATAPFNITLSGALTANSATINGQFTSKSTAGTTLMDVFQDTNGGIIQVYDNSGNLNCKLGVESGTASNTGGTMILYNDSVSNPRVALGIDASLDAGVINLSDTADNVRASMKAYDGGAGSPAFFLVDAASAVVTYLTLTTGYINSVQIATQAWAAQSGVNVSTHYHTHNVTVGSASYTTDTDVHNHVQN